FFVLSLTLFSQAALFAQVDSAAKYANTITADGLKKHLTIVASTEMDGRETGTEGQRKAALYIENQFKQIGLTAPSALNGYQQFYPLYLDSLSSELTVNKKVAVYGADYISPATNNDNANIKAKKIVFAGYGIEDSAYNDYANTDVKGKIVVFFLGEPKKEGKFYISGSDKYSKWTYPGLSTKLALAKAKGAAGVFVISPMQDVFTQKSIENSKKTNLYFPHVDAGKPINYAMLSHAFAKSILGEKFDTLLKQVKATQPITAGPLPETKQSVQFKYKKIRVIVNASNVLGVIEGTDKKEEYLFLTSHYDHLGNHNGKIYYGADDDGSGTCGVIAMAEAFAKAKSEGRGPRRTIVFMIVSGEEKGLWGSEYYSDHPVFSLDKTTADLNTDMVGRVDTERKTADTLNYVYVIGHDKLSSELQGINEGANNQNTQMVLDYKYDDPNDQNRIYYRSDHYNFARKGVPILFFYDGMLKADYHQPTDTIEKINFELYEKRMRMIFHTAWEIANRNDMLKRDIPLTQGVR
ncbi:MAG: M20/M25/M40 family metallo-hydrolase, partial [Flavobacterium sp.]|nr:M20/M25/M40 family metallo-hydrolase [Pedobacter sp.]